MDGGKGHDAHAELVGWRQKAEVIAKRFEDFSALAGTVTSLYACAENADALHGLLGDDSREGELGLMGPKFPLPVLLPPNYPDEAKVGPLGGVRLYDSAGRPLHYCLDEWAQFHVLRGERTIPTRFMPIAADAARLFIDAPIAVAMLLPCHLRFISRRVPYALCLCGHGKGADDWTGADCPIAPNRMPGDTLPGKFWRDGDGNHTLPDHAFIPSWTPLPGGCLRTIPRLFVEHSMDPDWGLWNYIAHEVGRRLVVDEKYLASRHIRISAHCESEFYTARGDMAAGRVGAPGYFGVPVKAEHLTGWVSRFRSENSVMGDASIASAKVLRRMIDQVATLEADEGARVADERNRLVVSVARQAAKVGGSNRNASRNLKRTQSELSGVLSAALLQGEKLTVTDMAKRMKGGEGVARDTVKNAYMASDDPALLGLWARVVKHQRGRPRTARRGISPEEMKRYPSRSGD